MRKIIISLSLLTFGNITFADTPYNAMRTPGMYLTLGIGAAHTHYADNIVAYEGFLSDALPDILFSGVDQPSNTHFGAKASLGYIWNRNFDTEISYYNFASTGYNENSSGTDIHGQSYNNSEDYSISQQAVALNAVGRLPVGSDNEYRSDFYAKAGLAYTWVNMHIGFATNVLPGTFWDPNELNYDKKFEKGAVEPLIGLGYEINFGQNWAMSFEWIDIIAHGTKIGDPLDTKIQNASLFSVGGTYKF